MVLTGWNTPTLSANNTRSKPIRYLLGEIQPQALTELLREFAVRSLPYSQEVSGQQFEHLI